MSSTPRSGRSPGGACPRLSPGRATSFPSLLFVPKRQGRMERGEAERNPGNIACREFSPHCASLHSGYGGRGPTKKTSQRKAGRARWLAARATPWNVDGSRIGESVARQIAVCDPRDALRQLAVGFQEFLDGHPSLLEWDEQSARQRRVVRTSDPFAQPAQICL